MILISATLLKSTLKVIYNYYDNAFLVNLITMFITSCISKPLVRYIVQSLCKRFKKGY